MPRDIQELDSDFPSFTGRESPARQVQLIHEYLYKLRERLQFSLHNLTERNFNDTALNNLKLTQAQKQQLDTALKAVTDMLSVVETVLGSVEGRVNTNEESIGTLQAHMSEAQTDILFLEDGAQALSREVEDIREDAQKLEGRVAANEVDIDGLADQAAGHEQRLKTAEGQVDQLEQGKVPVTRTVNGKALRADISLGPADVGADAQGSAQAALEAAKAHTLEKIAALINGAPGTMDTLKEIADAMTAHQDVVAALEAAIGSKVPISRTVNGKALSADISLGPADVGADAQGSAQAALEAAKAHTLERIAALINGAPGTLDTLKEIADAMTAHQGVVTALEAAIGSKVPMTRTVNGKALNQDISLGPADVGADAEGSAQAALEAAKAHTLEKIAALINGAPGTMDTLKEIADAMAAHQDVVAALEAAIGSKASDTDLKSHTGNKNNPHGLTLTQLAITVSAGVINLLEGLTGNVQAQLDGKALSGHSHPQASKTSAGLLSPEDKVKLDGITPGANAIVVDSQISDQSENPVQNKVVRAYVEDTAEFTKMRTAGQKEARAEGKRICIESTYAAPFLYELAIYGKSIQNGAPDPDAPIEIQNVGDSGSIEAVSTGKNLLPYPFFETTVTKNGMTFTDNGDGSITLNGTTSTASYFHFSTKYRLLGLAAIGGKYTLSGGLSSNISLSMEAVEGVSNADHGNGCTFDLSLLTGRIYIRVSSGVTAENIVVRPMLEFGEAKTSYEPPIGTTANFTTGLPLCGIPVTSGGNVTIDGQAYIADILRLKRTGGTLERWVEKKQLLSSHIAAVEYTNENVTSFRTWLGFNQKPEGGVNAKAISTYLRPNSRYGQFNGSVSFSFNSSGAMFITVPSAIATTTDGLKAWLDGLETPFFVYAARIEPIGTELTEGEKQAFLGLQTYGSVSNLFSSEGAYQSVVYASEQMAVNARMKESGKALVPMSRTVNGKALSADISLGAEDVGADAKGSAAKALEEAKTHTQEKIEALTAADVGAATLEDIQTAIAGAIAGSY